MFDLVSCAQVVGGTDVFLSSSDYLTEPQTLPPVYTSHESPATHGRRGREKSYSSEGDLIHSGWPSAEPSEGSGTQSRGDPSQGKGMTEKISSALRNGTSRFRYPVAPPPPVLIAVMGKTGTGKTSFVNAITGKGLTVGHSLEACEYSLSTAFPFIYLKDSPNRAVGTQDIQTAGTTINGREVWLIDTPGFDDTHRSDVDILATIANWVQWVSHQRKHLSGIIYLHRISDTRMEGSNMKNLRMFRELCGEKNFNNVILCTTMWEKVDEEEGQRREQELRSKENFWGNLVSRGAQVVRHQGPDLTTSARKIAETLIEKDTIVLQLQQELDRNGSLSNTSAGRVLTSQIEEIKKKHQEEMEALKAEMKAASDREEIELLKEFYRKEIEGLRKANEDMEKLRAEDARRFHEKLQEMQHQLDKRGGGCVVC